MSIDITANSSIQNLRVLYAGSLDTEEIDKSRFPPLYADNLHIAQNLQRFARYCMNIRPTGSCLYWKNPQAASSDLSAIGPNAVVIMLIILKIIMLIIL